MTTTYRWRPTAQLSGNAQAVGEVLSALVQKHSDRLTARVVLDEARPEQSPLHRYFLWDNAMAAEKYREEQARLVMRSIEVQQGEDTPQPMFTVVVEQVGEDQQKAYVTTARVLSDPALTLQVLEQAMADLESFRVRYGRFRSLARIADKAQGDLGNLIKEQSAVA